MPVPGRAAEFRLSARYVGSLLYLAIPGSVIGFTAYLTLVGRMGPDRAAYCTVLFPVVALNISAFAEGYRWTAPALAGLVLVMLGNVLRSASRRRWRWPGRRARPSGEGGALSRVATPAD